jgi:hypothetical protein
MKAAMNSHVAQERHTSNKPRLAGCYDIVEKRSLPLHSYCPKHFP